MRIISRKRLRDFATKHADAGQLLDDWYTVVRRADWHTPTDVRRMFSTASFVGDVVVFNIGGNKYRLTVNIRYQYHTVYIRRVMTHEEYDAGNL
jgi:mRNA interferase HigB